MRVIIINGPMGVGKTTVGKYIADTNPGTAFIDGERNGLPQASLRSVSFLHWMMLLTQMT